MSASATHSGNHPCILQDCDPETVGVLKGPKGQYKHRQNLKVSNVILFSLHSIPMRVAVIISILQIKELSLREVTQTRKQ